MRVKVMTLTPLKRKETILTDAPGALYKSEVNVVASSFYFYVYTGNTNEKVNISE